MTTPIYFRGLVAMAKEPRATKVLDMEQGRVLEGRNVHYVK